ncbi:unnamed protein product, partial [Ectocarpus fasciculatus]
GYCVYAIQNSTARNLYCSPLFGCRVFCSRCVLSVLRILVHLEVGVFRLGTPTNVLTGVFLTKIVVTALLGESESILVWEYDTGSAWCRPPFVEEGESVWYKAC